MRPRTASSTTRKKISRSQPEDRYGERGRHQARLPSGLRHPSGGRTGRCEDGWRYVDENRFEWRLEVEADLTAMKQAAKNHNTEEVEAESISYAGLSVFWD